MIDFLSEILNFFLHIDRHLVEVSASYGLWTYGILFAIIFMETGFVVTPFLPGDSLLFAAGALAGIGSLQIVPLLFLLVVAAFLGDTVNYWIGHFIGPKVFEGKNKLLKKEHLLKAQAFYEKHGGKAIVLARFVPIVRTFAPFVAGVGKMNYGKFLFYNIAGGIIWVILFTLSGFFFGNLPTVKENFHNVIIAIILISILPMVWEWYKAKKER